MSGRVAPSNSLVPGRITRPPLQPGMHLTVAGYGCVMGGDSVGVRSPTLQRVALAAGVSRTTASDALRGRGRMSQATRLHVIAVAKRMGYRGNGVARQLRKGVLQDSVLVEFDSSSTCYADGTLTPFWSRVLTGFVLAAGEDGYQTQVGIDSAPEELASANAAAVVYATLRLDQLKLPAEVEFGSKRCFAAAPERLVASDGRFTDLALGYDVNTIGRTLGGHLVSRAGVRRLLVIRGETYFAATDLQDAIGEEIGSMTELHAEVDVAGLRQRVAAVMRADNEIDGVLDLANQGHTILRGMTDARGHEVIGRRNGVTFVRACEVPPWHLHDPRVMYLSPEGMLAGKKLARRVISAVGGAPLVGERLPWRIVDPLLWLDE